MVLFISVKIDKANPDPYEKCLEGDLIEIEKGSFSFYGGAVDLFSELHFYELGISESNPDLDSNPDSHILGKRYSFADLTTLEYLLSLEIDIFDESILEILFKYSCFDSIKYFLDVNPEPREVFDYYYTTVINPDLHRRFFEFLIEINYGFSAVKMYWYMRNKFLTPFIKEGNLDALMRLNDLGLRIKINNYQSLIGAIENNRYEIIDWLISIGVSINAIRGKSFGNDSSYALEIAVRRSSMEMIQYLLNLGADIKSKGNVFMWFACKRGRMDVVKLLFDLGSGLSDYVRKRFLGEEESKPKPILAAAIQSDDIDVVKFIVEMGSPIPDDIYLYVRSYNLDIISYLLNSGLRITNELVTAMILNEQLDILKILVENDTEEPIIGNPSYLNLCIEESKISILKYFFEKGATISEIDMNLVAGLSLSGNLNQFAGEIIDFICEQISASGTDPRVLIDAAKINGTSSLMIYLEDKWGWFAIKN